jgi:hypothetical protein
LEGVRNSTISVEPNPLTVPAENANGILRLTAVGGEVRMGRARAFADAGEPRFRATGCTDVTIVREGICNVTVEPEAGAGMRPTRGTVRINYRNDNGDALTTAASVRIN